MTISVVELWVNDDGSVGMSGAIPAGSHAAIGSFDGVHLGHVRVLEQALRRGPGGRTVVFFDPHPHEFFRPDGAPFRLSRTEQQLKLFAALGMDHAVIIRFDANLARMSPEVFAGKVLKDALGIASISAGFDFNFGARGAGKAADLVAYGTRLGFAVDILDCQFGADGEKLSSTAVREALVRGDVAAARATLGRPHAILGEVIPGAQMGRTIGFPTLNIALGPYQRPKYGIYVTQTTLPDGRIIDGVSNIGVRPTVGGDIELLETYLFDFNEDIYRQDVETALLDYIRPEAKFESLDALKVEIDKDVVKARTWFAANPTAS